MTGSSSVAETAFTPGRCLRVDYRGALRAAAPTGPLLRRFWFPKSAHAAVDGMTSRRTQKAAEAIREVVSMAILTELKDPRVRDVTVTYVEVSPDMRQAKVHVSVMGDETRQKLTLHGLQNAAGFLQSKVAKRIDTRYTPRLAFVLDLGVKRSIEISQILHSVLPPSNPDTVDADETDTPRHDTEDTAAEPAEEFDDQQTRREDRHPPE